MDEPRAKSRPLCPLYIDLTGRRCVIVGAGRLAARRIRTLLDGGADIHVIAPELGAAVAAHAEKGSISAECRKYRPGDLSGAFLAVAATPDADVNAEVGREAAERGCLLNDVSDAGAGDTMVPAQIVRGDLRVAVSSSGAAPTVSARVRRMIEDALDDEWEPYLDALATVRLAARERLDAEQRRAVSECASRPDLRHEIVSRSAEEGGEGLLDWLVSLCTEGEQPSRAFVSLVGAGPGDPGLITAKGLSRLREADVVVQDHLADERLVSEAPAHAERIYVGKRGGHDYLRQEAINELLVAKALEDGGRRVVRLKGGDPFVFGRGGEEALALLEAGVPFEVVPGVSSGHAVPAAAGIPVTHRGLSTSVVFVTGHEDPSKGRSDVDWPLLASAAQTICVFMGVRNAESIASGLMAGGRPSSEPAAVIRWGTTPRQTTHTTTLGALAGDIERLGLEPPALIVVGDVVSLREQLGIGE